ncbi:MAG: outer membrane beta-barrel protein [Proteobacteria bacterium]|nr:outer membrane beta-barrel protein [Pseudomonadota bacterium]
MKSRVLKKLFLFLALLFTFYFSSFAYAQDKLFTSSKHAGYLTLLKNGFIDEVDSGGDKGKVNQNNGEKDKNKFYHQKKFHISASIGFCEGANSTTNISVGPANYIPGSIFSLLIDYLLNDFVGLGIEGGYHNLYGTEGMDPTKLDENNFFLSPYFKILMPQSSDWGYFLNFGVGLFMENSGFDEQDSDFRLSFQVGLGINYKITNNFESGLMLDYRFMKATWSAGYDSIPKGWFYLISVSPFIGYVF